MGKNKSREQCYVLIDKKFVKAKAHHVGEVVYDKRTKERIGVLLEPNPNTNMLRLKLDEGGTITIR